MGMVRMINRISRKSRNNYESTEFQVRLFV